MRVPVELRRAYRLLNHGPTTLVTASHAGRRNVMAAAWAMPLDYDPPKVAVVIAEGTYTRGLVEASGELVLSVPTAAQADLTWAVGSCSGRDVDKFARFGINVDQVVNVDAPLIDGCAAWHACRVIPEPEMGRKYDLFLCEVTAAWADDRAWKQGEWQFERDEDRTIHHLSRGVFFATGARLQARDPKD